MSKNSSIVLRGVLQKIYDNPLNMGSKGKYFLSQINDKHIAICTADEQGMLEHLWSNVQLEGRYIDGFFYVIKISSAKDVTENDVFPTRKISLFECEAS